MRIISFGWTKEALLAGAKTVTRRNWKDSYARSFKAGERLQAWSKVPYAGGKRIGTIELTHPLVKERTGLMDSLHDYRDEGFWWMHHNGIKLPIGSPWPDMDAYHAFNEWMKADVPMWVVRFRLIEVTP